VPAFLGIGSALPVWSVLKITPLNHLMKKSFAFSVALVWSGVLSLSWGAALTTSTNALSANSVVAVPTTGLTVTTDPTVALTNYTGLGEWNTNGNYESWTLQGSSAASVTGGLLSGTASTTNPLVQLTGLSTHGPDLDLAFNDYLDVRLQVPTAFGGSVRVYFGATNNYTYTANATTGFNTNRSLSFTPATDGAFHVYRIFFGPHAYWRGNLSDVRIDPLGNAATVGQAFALDYVRVGDLTGDIYVPSVSSSAPAAGVNNGNGFPVIEMNSKHFRFCWDVSVTSNSFWTASMPHGSLRNLEETWKNQVWRMGYPEPSHPMGSALPYTGTKYKVTFTTWESGYWAGGDANNVPWMNITPDGMVVEPSTWVPPHEFTHACQESANTNGSQVVDGQFWENNANYGREQWLYNYPWELNQSGLDPYYADTSHFWLGHGRNYYLCWPFWLYLDENPDNLPGLGSSYGSFFSVNIWKYAKSGEYMWDTLARLAPATSVQDIMGYVARRNAVWDYSHRTAMTNAANTGDMEIHQHWTYAELRQRADDTNWWQTPLEFAPQQGGYKIVKLVPQGSGAGRVVSVNFHGLADATCGADWRASLVVVADGGAVRYSGLWRAGTNSVTLAANENTVYLTVAGTPTNFLAESTDETVQPYPTAPSKARFPYEIQVTGATPYETPAASTSGLVQHANGGGWKASTALVDATAYLGPNARVLGSARVRGNARILDYAIIEGSAVVTNYAVVSGHALVRDTAWVKDYAKVRDYGMVIDNSVVGGHARVLQHGEIFGGAIITDWATVKGSASAWRDTSVATNAEAWNDAVLDGDFSTAQSCSNGFQFGFLEYNAGPIEWITNRTAPRRLFALYDFAAAHDSLAKDAAGVTDGYLLGSPTWYANDGKHAGFLAFNGANQAVALDRSLSDLPEITIAAWVKWSGGTSNQPVWFFGSALTNGMYFTPNDGTGHAVFVIRSGSTNQVLAGTNALAVGVWTHVAVALSNGQTGRLYINGNLVATTNVTLMPDQLNAPNVNTARQQNYLARGPAGALPAFQGALGDVRVYTGPLTGAEISALQPVGTLGGVGTLYVDLRATNAANSAQTLFATWTNFGVSVGNFTKTGSPTYTTNALSTGIPGILFNGTSSLYSSGNQSLADITGAGDRTIEVWAYNPALAVEETMVSLGDRIGTRTDCALNFGSSPGWGAVTHFNDDVSWGVRGAPGTNGWHHLVYVYDGATSVQIYVDGALWTSATLAGVLATPTGDPINIGCQRNTAAGGPASYYFSGYINAVRIWGGAMSASQVTSNYLFGPWQLPSAAQSLKLAAIPSYTLNAGAILSVTNSATDPNQPPLPLTFSLLSAPAGATIDPVSGQFTWRPTVAQANTTNLITVQVVNQAAVPLTATQSFAVTVNPVTTPQISQLQLANGRIGFRLSGSLGPDYQIQISTNLAAWTTLVSTNPATLPCDWVDSSQPTNPVQFYRVLLGP
jgi:carbonic anhydrase/acetyltransferase-like protein (isoleucine patch superfamily)